MAKLYIKKRCEGVQYLLFDELRFTLNYSSQNYLVRYIYIKISLSNLTQISLFIILVLCEGHTVMTTFIALWNNAN